MDREGGETAQMLDEQLVTRKRSRVVVVVSFFLLLRGFFFILENKRNSSHGWMDGDMMNAGLIYLICTTEKL